MGESTAQLILAGLGVLGTLSAALLTQVFQKRAERERRSADDARRWHSERFRVCRDFTLKMIEVRGIVYRIAALLPSDEVYEKLRNSGVEYFWGLNEDDIERHIPDSMSFNASYFRFLRDQEGELAALFVEVRKLSSEIQILSGNEVAVAAEKALDVALSAKLKLGMTQGLDGVTQAIDDMAAAIAQFRQCVRCELGMDEGA